MGKMVKYEFSDADIEKLQKVYELSKDKLPASINNFDDFLAWSVNVAIKTHIQLASINEKMMDFLNFSSTEFDDNGFNDISQFVNNIFEKESSKKTTVTNASEAKPTAKPKTVSKKN